MSGRFGCLYYTDCGPGQGLQGGAGFQFQAASPGIASEAMPLVQRTALYEPPVRWMRERRPLTDYPPSLAHTADGDLFATAAGCYLGQEVNGTREGNQFTHALVTRDPADYGSVRPAQLWGAPCWAHEPAPAAVLDGLAAHPAPGPLDVETVRDRVRAAAGGEALLTALLSAIHHLADSEHRRTVVLVSAQGEVAACWVAAATLLLPAPEALRVSFKIFVADGQYGQHDIIALHPEWAGRWADTGSGSGLAVFDLDHGDHTPVATTAAAGFWVPRLLTEDPYDVVDAVELASQFARARTVDHGARVEPPGTEPTWAEPTRADRLAAVVVAAGERLAAAACIEEVADWLLSAPDDAMRIGRDPVLVAVLDAAPQASILRTLAAAAGPRGWAPLAIQIRRGLLIAEIGEVLVAPDGLAALRILTALPPLPLLEWPDEQRERGRSDIEGALRAARPDQVPALLSVGARHAVAPGTAHFRSAAYEFAAWWVRQSDPDLAPERWHAPPEALDWVRDVLRDWLAGRPHAHAHAVEVIRSRWWHPLWPQACDPSDELDKQLMSVAYQHLEGSRRDQLVRDVQQWAFARAVGALHPSAGQPSTGQPSTGHPSTVAWDILFGAGTPVTADAAAFLTGLVDRGLGVCPEVAAKLCAVLEAEPALSKQGLWMINQLRAQGHPSPRLGIEVLLAAPRDTALAFLGGCSEQVATPIYEALKAHWPRPKGTATADHCRAVAFTFVLVSSGPDTHQQPTALHVLRQRLAELVAAMPKDVRAAVERSYPGGLGKPWWDWMSELEPHRLRLRRRSAAGPDQRPGRWGG